MKTTFTAVLATAMATLPAAVMADFYLYDGYQTTPDGDDMIITRVTSQGDKGDCDGIDNTPELDGADGEYSYPWPEESFTSKDPLCDVTLRFEKDGDNYKAYDDATGEEVASCTEGSNETTPCFWGFISAEYNEAYYCESSVCA